MRAMSIQVFTGTKGMTQMRAAFRKNRVHYFQEALGLAIFMGSACLFSALLFSPNSWVYDFFLADTMRNIVMGLMMGLTAIFIFYSRWTAPSGSQINPAVTISFWRLGKMCRYDALFFIIFQFAGSTITVYGMQILLGSILVDPPVNSVVTIPGKQGAGWALVTELIIAFITMTTVLFTSHSYLKRYTRIFSAILVCIWVILAGPLSGFGMNPARSFASALPSGIWTSYWIYFVIPIAGMLSATEFFLFIQRKKSKYQVKQLPIKKVKKIIEPLEFVI